MTAVGEPTWESIAGFEELCKSAHLIWGRGLAVVHDKLGPGFAHLPLREGVGWKLVSEDRFVSYSAGSRRHGGVPYYKLSSGLLGKIKVVGTGYLPTVDDHATLIQIE